MKTTEITPNCPDCGVNVGEHHINGCDVERCPECGHQALSCSCSFITAPSIKWTGFWPGVKECQEFGWYSKLVPGRGWCDAQEDDPKSTEDLNRMYMDAKWDKEQQRFVKKEKVIK